MGPEEKGGHVGKALAVAVGDCQLGLGPLAAEGGQGRCAGGKREEGCCIGARVGERGSRGSKGPGASRSQILELASGVQWGPRWCGRWERGASTRDVARMLHWGWCVRGVAELHTGRQLYKGLCSCHGMGGSGELWGWSGDGKPGGGLQVMGRELGEDGATESWAEVYVVGGWGKPGWGQSGVDGLGQRTSQSTKESRGQKN